MALMFLAGFQWPRTVVDKLISQQSQISTVQQLKFLLRARFFKLKLLIMPLLQNRLTHSMVFCGRAILKSQRAACGSCELQFANHCPTTAIPWLLLPNQLTPPFLLMPLLQNRLGQAVVFCGRATLKGPKSHMWLASRSLPTTGLDHVA